MKTPTLILIYSFLLSIIFIVTSCKNNNPTAHFHPETEDYIKMAEDSLLSNLAVSKEALQKAVALTVNPTGHERIQLLQATIFFYESKIDSAISLLNDLEKNCINLHPTPYFTLSGIYSTRAKIYQKKYQADSAVIAFNRAYQYLLQSGEHQHLPNLSINLADAYNMNGEYAQCASYYRKALMQIDSLGLSADRKPTIYSGLGHTYLELRNFELSDYYYDMSSEYFEKMNFIEKYFYLNNRGSHYYFRKEYERSLAYFLQARSLALSQPDREHQQQLAAINLAELYLIRGDFDSSRKLLAECEPYFRKIKNETGIYYVETLQIALAIREENWKTAAQLIQNSFTPAYIYPNILNIRQSYLKEFYEKTGNFRQAYESLLLEKHLEDSIRNESVRKNVAEIEFRYQQDTTLINQTLLLHKKENETRTLKNSLALILSFSILLIAGIILYMKKQREYSQIKNRYQLVNLKMENIRNRISPHFIFNNLNRILHTPVDAETRITHLENLIHLLRKNLEIVNQTIIPLEEELNFVKNYFNLEKATFGEDIDFTIEISPEVNPAEFLLPAMLIQIPVENALKHALKGKEGKKELHIRIRKAQNRYFIEISDNGPGYHVIRTSNPNNTGNGLRILSQTIHTMNSQNKEEMQFNISNIREGEKVTGCKITITIPENYKYAL